MNNNKWWQGQCTHTVAPARRCLCKHTGGNLSQQWCTCPQRQACPIHRNPQMTVCACMCVCMYVCNIVPMFVCRVLVCLVHMHVRNFVYACALFSFWTIAEIVRWLCLYTHVCVHCLCTHASVRMRMWLQYASIPMHVYITHACVYNPCMCM